MLVSASTPKTNGADKAPMNSPSANAAAKTAAKQPSIAELQARIAELEAAATRRTTLSYKLSEKGALSVYGLGRFPVTLYKQQWLRLLAGKEDMLAILNDPANKFAEKE